MATWDAQSYISEAICRGRKTMPPTSFSLSYESFTHQVLLRSQDSASVTEALNEEYGGMLQISTDILSNKKTTVHFRDHTGAPPFTGEELGDRVSGIAMTLLEGTDIDERFADIAKSFHVDIDDEPLTSEEKQELSVLSALQALPEENALVTHGDAQIALASERPWRIGVRGADGTAYTRNEELQGCQAILYGAASKQFERGVAITVALLGTDIKELFCISSLVRRLKDYESLRVFLQLLARTPSTVSNFYCDGSDCFSESLDSIINPDSAESKSHTNLWNMKRFVVDTVKSGNTADAAHLLQSKHNPAIFSQCKNLVMMLPRIIVALTVHSQFGNVFMEECFDSFQFLDREKKYGLLVIQRSSSLYNQMLEPGAIAKLRFSDSPECQLYSPRLLLAPEGDPEGCSFTVVHSSSVGDCGLIVGSVELARGGGQFPVFFDNKTVSVDFSANELFAAPFVATLLHRDFGLVGFSGYGCTMASNYPPILAVTTVAHYAEFPLEEGTFDPNVVLHYFNDRQTELDGKDFAQLFDGLPVDLSKKDALSESKLSARVRCRLIRVIPNPSSGSVTVLLGVNSVNIFPNTTVLAKTV